MVYFFINLTNSFAETFNHNDISQNNNLFNAEINKKLDQFFNQIIFDDVESIKKSIASGEISANAISKDNIPAIVLATKENRYKVIHFLINIDSINLEAENNFGENALMWACHHGNLPLVVELITIKNVAIDKVGWSAIHYAASAGHYDVVKFLIDHQANVDALSPNETTPMMLAARHGHIKVVKLLLDNGADLSIKNQQNMTAIDFARQSNQDEIMDGLISRWKKIYGNNY